MSRHAWVVAVALLGAALAATGCGFGAGADVGEVSLTVTRDYGAQRLLAPVHDEATESDTVMRLLDRSADITTRYGGGFVSSIDGLSEASRDGRRYDWFFYVDGVESSVGAADFPLRGGDAIWWDYRAWSAAERVPAVVGSWPQPLSGGYEGKRHPVTVECRAAGAACGLVRSRLAAAGVEAAAGAPQGAIRVLVGPWSHLRGDPAAAQLDAGPQASGVFAEFAAAPGLPGGVALRALDESGATARELGPSAGLVAATRRYGAPPVWLVTGATTAATRAAAGLLDAAHLRDHYAVAIENGRETPLPLGER
ncbi:MAG TPA: DUF4430 domain-containing protein [Solirubrobacterales bacterium]|nr:DUF4430 domain-containing protein [Solirubrobacterales bacterium]